MGGARRGRVWDENNVNVKIVLMHVVLQKLVKQM